MNFQMRGVNSIQDDDHENIHWVSLTWSLPSALPRMRSCCGSHTALPSPDLLAQIGLESPLVRDFLETFVLPLLRKQPNLGFVSDCGSVLGGLCVFDSERVQPIRGLLYIFIMWGWLAHVLSLPGWVDEFNWQNQLFCFYVKWQLDIIYSYSTWKGP